jgi:hypothetical protein
MTFPTCLRPSFARFGLLALSLAPGFLFRIEASDQPSPNSPPPAAITDQRHAAFQLLRELDLLLDHHPLIESDLRLDSSLLESEAYRAKHPALNQFLATNPDIGPVLKTEPRHFLHRALRREANVPLTWTEVAQLDAFLDQNPAVERQLVRNPALILSPNFLAIRPRLREFLEQNAALARGFLPGTLP